MLRQLTVLPNPLSGFQGKRKEGTGYPSPPNKFPITALSENQRAKWRTATTGWSCCEVIAGDDSHLHVAGTLALVLAQVAYVLYGVDRCPDAAPDTAHATPDERPVLATRSCTPQKSIATIPEASGAQPRLKSWGDQGLGPNTGAFARRCWVCEGPKVTSGKFLKTRLHSGDYLLWNFLLFENYGQEVNLKVGDQSPPVPTVVAPMRSMSVIVKIKYHLTPKMQKRTGLLLTCPRSVEQSDFRYRVRATKRTLSPSFLRMSP